MVRNQVFENPTWRTAAILNFKSYNFVVNFDIGVEFCTEVEVCSAK